MQPSGWNLLQQKLFHVFREENALDCSKMRGAVVFSEIIAVFGFVVFAAS